MKIIIQLRLFIVLSLVFSNLFFMSFGTDLDVTLTPSIHNGGYNISCHGASDGTLEAVIVGGVSPYSFQWSNGAYTKLISGLPAGVYSFTVIDANNDTVTKSFELIQAKALTGSLDPSVYEGGYNITQQGGSDGYIKTNISGGATPYTFLWSTSSNEEQISELTAGTYSVTVKDVNECPLTLSTTLTQPTPLHIVSITSPLHGGYNLSCQLSEDGEINLTVGGGVPPYEFVWNNGKFTEDLTDLKSGEYTVQVKDANGVKIFGTIVLSKPNGIDVSITPAVYTNGKNTSCFNCSNGSITTVVSGGVSPFSYHWSTGQTTANISGLMAGQYVLGITDANGCKTQDKEIGLSQPDRDDWTLNGNSNINSLNQFIGTNDSTELIFKSNQIEGLRINQNGELNIKSLSGGGAINYLYVDTIGNLHRASGPPGGGNTYPYCNIPVMPWYSNDPDLTNIYLCNTSNVGMGTNTPSAHLHLNYSDGQGLLINMNNYPNVGDPLKIVDDQNNLLFKINNTGVGTLNSLGVNTTYVPNGFKLSVNGKIICEEIKVKMYSTWPDYVFGQKYQLLNLMDLDKYIKTNRHLPGVKSASEIENDGGIALSETTQILMEKIEELTLYIIEQEKRISYLEKRK